MGDYIRGSILKQFFSRFPLSACTSNVSRKFFLTGVCRNRFTGTDVRSRGNVTRMRLLLSFVIGIPKKKKKK